MTASKSVDSHRSLIERTLCRTPCDIEPQLQSNHADFRMMVWAMLWLVSLSPSGAVSTSSDKEHPNENQVVFDGTDNGESHNVFNAHHTQVNEGFQSSFENVEYPKQTSTAPSAYDPDCDGVSFGQYFGQPEQFLENSFLEVDGLSANQWQNPKPPNIIPIIDLTQDDSDTSNNVLPDQSKHLIQQISQSPNPVSANTADPESFKTNQISSQYPQRFAGKIPTTQFWVSSLNPNAKKYHPSLFNLQELFISDKSGRLSPYWSAVRAKVCRTIDNILSSNPNACSCHHQNNGAFCCFNPVRIKGCDDAVAFIVDQTDPHLDSNLKWADSGNSRLSVWQTRHRLPIQAAMILSEMSAAFRFSQPFIFHRPLLSLFWNASLLRLYLVTDCQSTFKYYMESLTADIRMKQCFRSGSDPIVVQHPQIEELLKHNLFHALRHIAVFQNLGKPGCDEILYERKIT
uniref:Uncharacterized protein n=1 Tax=Spongospora subterranea TaxID=70186 RepID=A0A0H5RKX2_9EUKA|eukprot:CRZ09364.1 hypothetical protein [Spongospora subterranea]